MAEYESGNPDRQVAARLAARRITAESLYKYDMQEAHKVNPPTFSSLSTDEQNSYLVRVDLIVSVYRAHYKRQRDAEAPAA